MTALTWREGTVPSRYYADAPDEDLRFYVEKRDGGPSWWVVVFPLTLVPGTQTRIVLPGADQVDVDAGHPTMRMARAVAEAYAGLGPSRFGPSRMVRAIDRAYGVPADKTQRESE